jgi:protein O-GlcNAc transferase
VLASRIRALDLDTLVNLDGFSTTTRFDVFAEHPVPVQASWHNTHYSFGGRLFDRIVADKVVLSEAEASEYAETIVRLPDCYFAIEPLSWAPDVSPPPLASEGRVTFGTFNRPDKISDEAARCWSRIVNAVPNSRIYLRNGGFNHPGARDAIRLRLAKAGIDPLRIYIEGGADDVEFLNSYRHIDVALDTFPFNGGFTTYQALWQGVPLPAFCGERWAARVSFSILKAAGLDELLAADQPGYEELIIALAQDPDRLAALRQTIRARVAASPFTDMAGFARNFADALR